jgi:predicted ferric reductase
MLANSRGGSLTAGQLAFMLQLVMASFSFKHFRQHYYKLFRAAHALFPVILAFSVVHMGTMNLYFFQLGMILYTADVTQGFTTKLHTASGTASAAAGSDSSSSERVVVLRATAPNLCSESMPGRFFYVQVPAISKLEWHPLSVSSCDAVSGTVTFGIKATGM